MAVRTILFDVFGYSSVPQLSIISGFWCGARGRFKCV